MKKIIRGLLATTPYRLVRDNGANRFEGLESALLLMKARGFEPDVIIDGGAHTGGFSLAARRIFPVSDYHLVEPQPSCATRLQALCADHGWTFHQCALSNNRGASWLRLTQEFDTGAYISDDPADTRVRMETIDALFGNLLIGRSVLLKLDLQGHEIQALKGATNTLRLVDVVLSEVSFFSHVALPLVTDLIAFMAGHDFALYDVSALHGRTRDNRLKQGDLIFARAGSILRQDDRWE
jgi:FkbM family methyltransferase